MNLDQLLDGTIDQLADKPEFKPFPPGAHAVQTFFKPKKFGTNGFDGEGFEINFKYVEVGELTNPEEAVPKAGDTGSIIVNLTSKNEMQREFAQGTFKMFMQALATKFGAKTPRELIEDANGANALIVTSLRSNKDKTANFLEVSKVEYL